MSPLPVTVLVFSLYASAAPEVMPRDQSPFEKGIALYEQGKAAESIPYFEKALRRYPEGSNILWNLGLASASAGQHEKALTYWQRYRKLRVADYRAIPKLIQTYQALERLKERDEWLDRLFHLRKVTRDEEWKKIPYFCREQFQMNGRLVLAYQFFKPSGEWMQFYRFSVTDGKGQEAFFISFGSYDQTTQISRELGEIKANERLYHFDGYYPDGVHKTFGFLEGERTPSYDEIRPTVLKILKGEIDAVSSSQFK